MSFSKIARLTKNHINYEHFQTLVISERFPNVLYRWLKLTTFFINNESKLSQTFTPVSDKMETINDSMTRQPFSSLLTLNMYCIKLVSVCILYKEEIKLLTPFSDICIRKSIAWYICGYLTVVFFFVVLVQLFFDYLWLQYPYKLRNGSVQTEWWSCPF